MSGSMKVRRIATGFRVLFVVILSQLSFAAVAETPDGHAAPGRDHQCAGPGFEACIVGFLWQQATEWADAWANHDLDMYFSFYQAEFSPVRNLNRAQWEKSRRERILEARGIRLKIHLLDSVVRSESATLHILQEYSTDDYQDAVIKSLVFRNIGGRYTIVEENSGDPLTRQEVSKLLEGL